MRILPGFLSLPGHIQGTGFRLPLKCDMCEGEDEPLCVKWCIVDALTLDVREEEVEEFPERDELEIGLESLADRYGIEKILETVARISKKD